MAATYPLPDEVVDPGSGEGGRRSLTLQSQRPLRDHVQPKNPNQQPLVGVPRMCAHGKRHTRCRVFVVEHGIHPSKRRFRPAQRALESIEGGGRLPVLARHHVPHLIIGLELELERVGTWVQGDKLLVHERQLVRGGLVFLLLGRDLVSALGLVPEPALAGPDQHQAAAQRGRGIHGRQNERV